MFEAPLVRGDPGRAESMGLSADELAFYAALAQSASAVQVLSDAQLRTIARELGEECARECDHRLESARQCPRRGGSDTDDRPYL